ncbi:hypothetical protein [Pseudodesulfovibrio sediminis]|uniref:Uncharacterized protein n=1 Tax=Pseudodesulfovibrio sediminis TaxID=2810563 RepID=A0ABN6EQU9_9BACT|nr:hypothetical protein [Pseudodesulfovibrio sediminis]BCS88797.1 hypothetical protein PSDVSF_20390 [Pseudodesulfovibrio sediminis]
MIVKCIGNAREHLSSKRSKQAWDKYCNIEETCCEIGEKYIVYGIIFFDFDVPQFLICTSEDDQYPVPHFAEHFKILEGDIPEGWVFKSETPDYEGPVILPKRIANEYIFMEKLYDGDPDAVQCFLQLKEEMKEKYKDKL